MRVRRADRSEVRAGHVVAFNYCGEPRLPDDASLWLVLGMPRQSCTCCLTLRMLDLAHGTVVESSVQDEDGILLVLG